MIHKTIDETRSFFFSYYDHNNSNSAECYQKLSIGKVVLCQNIILGKLGSKIRKDFQIGMF